MRQTRISKATTPILSIVSLPVTTRTDSLITAKMCSSWFDAKSLQITRFPSFFEE